MNTEEAKQLLRSAMSKPPSAIPAIDTSPLYLYGAGAFGRQTFRALAKQGIAVTAFLDKNAKPGQYLYDIPVYQPDVPEVTAHGQAEAVIILSIVMTYETRLPLIQKLQSLGFRQIIDGQFLRAHEVPYNSGTKNANWADSALTDAIFSAVALFCDEASVDVYVRNVCAHILRDYSNCAESINCPQYFPHDVPLNKGYARFVDCGAYVGDTAMRLTETVGNIEAYIGFEPDADNFLRLAHTVKELKEKLSPAFLYPCAVGGANGVVNFAPAEGSGTISNEGQAHVQVIRLDETLINFQPSFIKMDIEGMELSALQGAENIIRDYDPDLAVCVYHNISDYFEIPLLLSRMNPRYRFYLRTHSSCTMETVLYATEWRH
jgi:FkbM family methyltransferase